MEDLERLHLTKELKLEHWGDGPWVEEPDFKRFTHCGIDCLVMRMAVLDGHNLSHLSGGYLCGYVILPITHPWVGNGSSEIGCEVHGGITLFQRPDGERLWVGFDCAHSGDLVPSMREFNEKRRLRIQDEERARAVGLLSIAFFREPVYKDFEFVVEQTKKLAEQAKQAMGVL